MNVFFPFFKPANKLLHEIEPYFKGRFIFDNYVNWNKYKDIKIINIHWPEKIFEWEEPTGEELNNFIETFNYWKKCFKIVYTRHNIYPHYRKSINFVKLYDFVANNSDAVIHFGNYSKKEFLQRYTNFKGLTKIIEHPLYLNKLKTISKENARKALKINSNDKVVLIIGYIRSKEEKDLVLKSFAKVNIKKKLLIVTNDIKYNSPNWLYSYKVKKIYKYFKNKFYVKENGFCILNKNFIGDEELAVYLNAADVLLIPRIHLLNSGNLYLGFTFNKMMIAPSIGNITEKIEGTQNITYNPLNKKSLTLAIEKAFRHQTELDNFKIALRTMHPKIVAKELFSFFDSFLKH